MLHNKFDNLLRVLAAVSLFFIVACSEGTDTKSKATADADSVSEESVDIDRSGPGTWGDIVYGAEDAPVTIIEYASLTCHHCALFTNEILPKIEKEYIDTGKVKIVYRNFLLNRVDMAASTVARCGDMETTKKLMKVFFARQDDWLRDKNPTDALAGLARRAANMSRVEFDRCLSNKEMHKNLVEMTDEGRKKFDVSGTPTLIVNGKAIENYAYETVKEAVDADL